MAVPRILIVSDDASSSAAMVRTLTSLGYQVFASEDLDGGLDLFQPNHYSVVIVESCHGSEAGLALIDQLFEQDSDVACLFICDSPEQAAQHPGVLSCQSWPLDADDQLDAIERVLCDDTHVFGEADVDTSSPMVKSDRPAWCEVCGYSTHWRHQKLLRYFCSEGCLTQYLRSC